MMQEVDLSGCQLVTDLGIRALTSSCRNLESVNVSSCYELSDAAFESLGTCSGLRSLDACGCEQLTDAGLQALAQGARYVNLGTSPKSCTLRPPMMCASRDRICSVPSKLLERPIDLDYVAFYTLESIALYSVSKLLSLKIVAAWRSTPICSVSVSGELRL